MSGKTKRGNGGNGGNGGSRERRSGVDRRICDPPEHQDPERRRAARRKPERLPDKPIKR